MKKLKTVADMTAESAILQYWNEIETGGVNTGNIKEYIDAPFIHAVGGSWVCPKAEISAGNWEKITQLCLDARAAAKG